jgi:hypothetical protein
MSRSFHREKPPQCHPHANRRIPPEMITNSRILRPSLLVNMNGHPRQQPAVMPSPRLAYQVQKAPMLTVTGLPDMRPRSRRPIVYPSASASVTPIPFRPPQCPQLTNTTTYLPNPSVSALGPQPPGKEPSVQKDGDTYIVLCPHCVTLALIHEQNVNCGIFRHGVFKRTGQPIPPHSPKELCDRLLARDLIDGCGKPFRFDGRTITACDYI